MKHSLFCIYFVLVLMEEGSKTSILLSEKSQLEEVRLFFVM